MKSLNKRLEKFCYNHPNFGIPKFMTYYVIACAAVFLLYKMDTTNTFVSLLTFSPYHILHGQVWRIITWVLCPYDSRLFYEAVMLLFVYSIGSVVQAQFGTTKFTVYYLLGMLFNIVYSFLVYFISNTQIYLTATYLNLSLFFAYAVMFPENKVLLMFIIPIKVKWLAIADAVYFAFIMLTYIISGRLCAGLLPIIAVLNFLVFFGDYLFGSLKHGSSRYSANTINFKRAAKQAKKNVDSQPYRHKCAVCGRTDVDHPELEFRYCSRCTGYHCFCMDHINSHVHFRD